MRNFIFVLCTVISKSLKIFKKAECLLLASLSLYSLHYFNIGFVFNTHIIFTPIIRLKTFCRLALRSQSYYWRTMAITKEELYEKRERRNMFYHATTCNKLLLQLNMYLQWYRAQYKKATRARHVGGFIFLIGLFSVFTN